MERIIQNINYQWGIDGYNNYKPNTTDLDLIKDKNKLKDLHVLIVMGTWCEDSQNQVPKILKIFDYLSITANEIEIYCVNREKQIFDSNIQKLGISLVPTIIFSHKGIELGRIIESPIQTLEKDIIELLKKLVQ